MTKSSEYTFFSADRRIKLLIQNQTKRRLDLDYQVLINTKRNEREITIGIHELKRWWQFWK